MKLSEEDEEILDDILHAQMTLQNSSTPETYEAFLKHPDHRQGLHEKIKAQQEILHSFRVSTFMILHDIDLRIDESEVATYRAILVLTFRDRYGRDPNDEDMPSIRAFAKAQVEAKTWARELRALTRREL